MDLLLLLTLLVLTIYNCDWLLLLLLLVSLLCYIGAKIVLFDLKSFALTSIDRLFSLELIFVENPGLSG